MKIEPDDVRKTNLTKRVLDNAFIATIAAAVFSAIQAMTAYQTGQMVPMAAHIAMTAVFLTVTRQLSKVWVDS